MSFKRRVQIDGRPVRVGAVIMANPESILLVKDRNDRYLEETRARINKRSSKTRHQIKLALESVETGKYSTPGGKIEPDDLSETVALARELKEELGLIADPDSMEEVCIIVGKNRAHILYLVTALGQISPNPAENITGIGLLEESSILPLTHDFYQQHVLSLHEYFFRLPYLEKYKYSQMTGKLRLGIDEAEKWYRDQMRAYQYRNSRNIPLPRMIESTIHLSLLSRTGTKIPPKDPIAPFTQSNRHRLPSPENRDTLPKDRFEFSRNGSYTDISTCQNLDIKAAICQITKNCLPSDHHPYPATQPEPQNTTSFEASLLAASTSDK